MTMNDKKPNHRPPNQVRLASMIRWFDVAKADTRLINFGDWRLLYKSPGKADVSTDRQIEILLSAIQASNKGGANTSSDWLEDHLASANLTPEEDDCLTWLVECLDCYSPPSTKPRGNKMTIYRVASALFNKALLHAQSHGQRLSEQPTNEKALERALNRLKRTSVE